MCCIFTCCGWMIDLIQRAWVFLMSCCMCSAVCMSVMTASMSGIAMGYNYSLAEYIDMKETNVSVFLKRGIFDDDIGADMGFRRGGHEAVPGLIRDRDLVTAEADEEEIPDRRSGSGRRLDDSVLQSNDNNRFEGSLMKLTAKPPAATETPPIVLGDGNMEEVFQKYTKDSLDQLKAIQSLMSMRRSNQERVTINFDKTTTPDPRRRYEAVLGRRMNTPIMDPSNEANQIKLNRADFPYEHYNPVRTLIPSNLIGASEPWLLAKQLERTMGRTLFNTDDYINDPETPHTYPHPIKYKTDVSRPTLSSRLPIVMTTPLIGPDEIPTPRMDTRRLDNSDVNLIKDKLLMDKSMFPSFRKSGDFPSDSQGIDKSEEADYEEEAKRGIRVRKKRNISTNPEGVIVKEKLYTTPSLLLNKYLKIENLHNVSVSAKSKNSSEIGNITNDTSNVTTNYLDENDISNVTYSKKKYAIKNETDRIGVAINSSTNKGIMDMSTIIIDELNNSTQTTINTKADPSILSFLKSLLN